MSVINANIASYFLIKINSRAVDNIKETLKGMMLNNTLNDKAMKDFYSKIV